jgi:hypothetical protein
MICKNCGTEIADKALICYRCGQATFESVRKPASTRPGVGPLVITVLLIVLVLGAAAVGVWDQDRTVQLAAWAVAVIGALLVAWRLFARRRTPVGGLGRR